MINFLLKYLMYNLSCFFLISAKFTATLIAKHLYLESSTRQVFPALEMSGVASESALS